MKQADHPDHMCAWGCRAVSMHQYAHNVLRNATTLSAMVALFSQKETERKSIRGEDAGANKRAYPWTGGEDERCFWPCARHVRASSLPSMPAPPSCTDPALTRAAAVRQSVRPVFVIRRHIEPHHWKTATAQRSHGRT